jgi:glycosyltransferase involved in cell wall biosynthesis
MSLISVIVPVYNVEKYLDRCVSSIVNQTYRNLEIILVDDGSPDNCPAMCDAWAKKDSRIKVVHQPNGGGAKARNAGLALVTGSYVGFVDSDDVIHPMMYETLLQIAQSSGCDISECGYYAFGSSDVIEPEPINISNHDIQCYSTEQALQENIRDHICRQLVWNKLYNCRTVENVRFVEGKYIDDEFFTYRALGNAKKIAVTHQKLYYYRQQQDSVMHQEYSLKWLDAIEAKQCRLRYLSDNFESLVGAAQINLLFTCMYHGQLSLKKLHNSQQREVMEILMGAVRNCSIPPWKDLRKLPVLQRLWVLFAKICLPLCCHLRNLLKIGL